MKIAGVDPAIIVSKRFMDIKRLAVVAKLAAVKRCLSRKAKTSSKPGYI